MHIYWFLSFNRVTLVKIDIKYLLVMRVHNNRVSDTHTHTYRQMKRHRKRERKRDRLKKNGSKIKEKRDASIMVTLSVLDTSWILAIQFNTIYVQ